MEFGALMMEPLTSATQWRDRVRRVEDAGLAVLHVSDHFDRSPVSPWLALAAAAQVSGRIRLGTLVLNNDFRHRPYWPRRWPPSRCSATAGWTSGSARDGWTPTTRSLASPGSRRAAGSTG